MEDGQNIVDITEGFDLDELMADVAVVVSQPRTTSPKGEPMVLGEDEQKLVAHATQTADGALETAQRIEVRNAQEAAVAVEFLTRVAGAKKKTETARTTLVGPLNDHVKMINDSFRPTKEAYETADALVREKVLGYQRAQEQIRAAEQARLDLEAEERRRAEEERLRAEAAKAQAEREAAAREAHLREQEARAAEQERLRRITAQRDERAGEIARMSEQQLASLMLSAETGSVDERLARDELEARTRKVAAEAAAAQARAAEEAARVAEENARNAPVPEAPKAVLAPSARLETAGGRVSEKKRWVGEIEDESRVPRQYLIVDQRLINAAIKDGVREIPGVRIYEKDELAVRAR